MRNSKLKILKRLSVISIVALTTILVVLGVTVKKLDYYATWTSHAQKVQYLASNIYSNCLKTESNMRGYVISGNNFFLNKYLAAKQNTTLLLNELLQKTTDDNEQQLNIKLLIQNIDQRFQFLHLLQQEYEANKQDALSQRVSASIMLSNAIETELVKIIDKETNLLAKRKAAFEKALNQIIIFFACCIVLALLLAIVSINSIRLYLKALKKHDKEIDVYQNKLQQKVQDLELSNRELEQFAFVASHDLQEPLRKIISFGGLLKEETIEGSKEASLLFIDKISDAALRMKTLINDLLQYSRCGKASDKVMPLNLKQSVEAVIETLSLTIAEKKALIQINVLNNVVVKGNETELQQVFQNLITNALKFNQSLTPTISIEAKEEAEQYIITVKDNGIGFEPAYAQQIFELFKRLHGKQAYAGTGIGLGICKKIIQKMNGTITASSALGKGSVFTIHLPKIIV